MIDLHYNHQNVILTFCLYKYHMHQCSIDFFAHFGPMNKIELFFSFIFSLLAIKAWWIRDVIKKKKLSQG